MPFKKGSVANPNGRPKGARNKASMQVVQEILDAAEARGGKGGVQAWLKSLDGKSFAMLFGKCVPREVNLDIGATDEVLAAIKARVAENVSG